MRQAESRCDSDFAHVRAGGLFRSDVGLSVRLIVSKSEYPTYRHLNVFQYRSM